MPRFAEPEVPDIVYIEQLNGAQYLEKPGDTSYRLDTFSRLSATVLGPDATISFITKISREM